MDETIVEKAGSAVDDYKTSDASYKRVKIYDGWECHKNKRVPAAPFTEVIGMAAKGPELVCRSVVWGVPKHSRSDVSSFLGCHNEGHLLCVCEVLKAPRQQPAAESGQLQPVKLWAWVCGCEHHRDGEYRAVCRALPKRVVLLLEPPESRPRCMMDESVSGILVTREELFLPYIREHEGDGAKKHSTTVKE